MIENLTGAMKSLTIWFNGILLGILPLLDMILESMPQLHDYLPDNIYKMVGVIAVVGNIVLRFKTNQPLKDK